MTTVVFDATGLQEPLGVAEGVGVGVTGEAGSLAHAESAPAIQRMSKDERSFTRLPFCQTFPRFFQRAVMISCT
jgi:hypothetical protein